ncbi:MAG: hypothetical protein ABIP20_13180 [Chthoniobacteraceae bacterium]
MNKGSGYKQTKILDCSNPPFRGLGALGLWYSYCLESELHKWQSDSTTAKLGPAKDCAAFCEHPAGYHIRRVLSDGRLLMVYDDRNQLLHDTLLPVAVPGDNLRLLEFSAVVPFLLTRGGYRCRFAINHLSFSGHVLDGSAYCAAWSDDQRGFLFETEKGKNPNAKILERL